MRFLRAIREFRNFLDYLKITRKESFNSPLWAKLNLRRDWVGRVYTVINLPPEVINSPDFPDEAKPAWVFEECKSINQYFLKLNLHELITVTFQPVTGTGNNSFLVIYTFLWRDLTFTYILSRTLIISLLIYAVAHYGVIASTILSLF
jgi:hypothetical protein